MTIMDVFDESALSNQAREDLYRNYTDAKLAHLKSGGNFPYLSRSEDVNMHVMVSAKYPVGLILENIYFSDIKNLLDEGSPEVI